MPPKRKSDVLEHPPVAVLDYEAESEKATNAKASDAKPPAAKKARVSSTGEGPSASGSGSKKGKAADAPKCWRDIVLEGEEEGEVPIYDDCNDIRRKIRALQKEPNFKITHWLQEIGNINNNSYQRFSCVAVRCVPANVLTEVLDTVKATGPDGGASNGTYYAAYVYFEKLRILQGKKKTAKRIRNEQEYPYGFSRQQPRGQWVLMPV
ncbi:hypothetical protein C8Q70DRAFT_1051306 [Cubamyces menziesii]|nr:hypothetical protein C8Q70DRAFT_1051306 [Cubamyces menziesii]